MPTPWRKGPPPCKGWWNASIAADPTCRRWWNGRRWSAPVYVGDPDVAAERAKRRPANIPNECLLYRGLTAKERQT